MTEISDNYKRVYPESASLSSTLQVGKQDQIRLLVKLGSSFTSVPLMNIQIRVLWIIWESPYLNNQILDLKNSGDSIDEASEAI